MSAAPDLPRAALRYAAKGIPVFPLAPRGKAPLIPKAHGGQGFHDATTDEAAVRGWWSQWPDANIGIATGHGLDVLDVDPAHGGQGTLAALVAAHGDLPATPRVATGGGGAHYYFRHHDGIRCSAGRLGRGLDVRGVGGYVVAPPSTHPTGGRYAWAGEARQLAPWPSWLVDLVLPSPPPQQVRPRRYGPSRTTGGTKYALAVLRGACEAIEDAIATCSHRHDTLRARARTVAGFVASGELEAELARGCLLNAWLGSGLTHREAEAYRTIDWAFESGLTAPLSTPEARRA